MQTPPEARSRKPVVALMGEFSAGKSTLANLLLDEGKSPVKVTATQMPPIWYTHGDGETLRVALDGTPSVLSDEELEEVSVEDTAYVLMRSQAEVLELMDLVDMPGISDPNLSSESWQRTIHNADMVIWCSHATQAWRQSEAATWNELAPELHARSLLLLTRFDKLLTEGDGQRVVNRVTSEAGHLFGGIFPISLLQATNAGDDREAWEASGAEPFMQSLLDTVFEISRIKAARTATETPSDAAETAASVQDQSVAPKRVRVQRDSSAGTERPPRSSAQEFFM